MKTYLTVLAGVWIGVAISILLVRHVTIPPMSWLFVTKLCVMAGVFCTPVMLFCTWCAETSNKLQRRQNGLPKDGRNP